MLTVITMVIVLLYSWQELDVRTNFFIYSCSSITWIRYFYLILICVYLGILQVFALYLAFQIRKVKVKGLDDAKYTTIVVFINTILVVTGFATSTIFSVANYINTASLLYGTAVWISATTVLGLMFIPKVHHCYSIHKPSCHDFVRMP